MLPPAVSYRGGFPRTLIDLHTTIISLSLAASSGIVDFLSQAIVPTCKRIHVLPRSSTCLDIVEGMIGARGFQYLTEAVFTGGLAFLLIKLCIMRRGVPHKELDVLRNNRSFLETVESNIPHVLRWYRVIKALDLEGRFMDCRDAFRSSPSIFDRTPSEAKRWHEEEIARGLWRNPPAPGKVRLHFFRTHRTWHDPNLFQHPDVRIDLDFDSSHGINLQKARKLLGVEKLSVITGLSPYRTKFDPHDRDKLSPLAVYDLSKQLREPIRVFEPCPSRITKIKRKIHDIASLSYHLVYAVLRSCLGFTIQNRSYLAATYGDNFAAMCTKLSRFIHPFNQWAQEAAWIIARLSAFLVLLPAVILTKAAAFVQSSLSFITQRSLRLLVSIVAVVRSISSSLSRLSLTELFVVIILSWVMFADFLLSTGTSKSP